MSEKQVKQLSKALEKVRQKYDTPAKALEFMKRAGILTSAGKLAKPYR